MLKSMKNEETKEIFRQVENFEGLYEVNNVGIVKSLPRQGTKGGVLTPIMTDDGYLQVWLCKDGKLTKFYLHRLVLETFIPIPDNLKHLPIEQIQCNHKDENKLNNVIVLNDDESVNEEASNLEWCSQAYNINYGTRNQRISKAVLQLNLDGTLVREWPSMSSAKSAGFNSGGICWCCKGKYSQYKGYLWKYKKNDEQE